MIFERSGYRLSSGRHVHANCGLLSVGRTWSGDDSLQLHDGYDSHALVAEADGSIPVDDDGAYDPRLTTAERHEIAEYVIAL